MDKKLPARPNLDHLRRQAKILLAQLNDGEPPAVQAFVEHLPEARRMTAGRGARRRLPSRRRAIGGRAPDRLRELAGAVASRAGAARPRRRVASRQPGSGRRAHARRDAVAYAAALRRRSVSHRVSRGELRRRVHDRRRRHARADRHRVCRRTRSRQHLLRHLRAERRSDDALPRPRRRVASGRVRRPRAAAATRSRACAASPPNGRPT